jgi:hypothetical protein
LWYCERITPIWKQKEKYEIKGSNFEWSHKTMDSKEACDIIDELFLSIDNPIWVPQYYFGLANIFSLLYRDIPLERIKTLLQSFNLGVREKLLSPANKEGSYNVVRQLKEACQVSNNSNDSFERDRESRQLDTRDVQFDF